MTGGRRIWGITGIRNVRLYGSVGVNGLAMQQ